MQCLRELCLLYPYSIRFDAALNTLLAKGTLRRLFILDASIYCRFSALGSSEAGSLDLFIIAFPHLSQEVMAKGSSGHNNISRSLRMTKRLLLVLSREHLPEKFVKGIDEVLQGVDGANARNIVQVGKGTYAPVIESVINGEIWDMKQICWNTYSAYPGHINAMNTSVVPDHLYDIMRSR
ncbi:hypothetical protein FRB94_011387 [Tulasnella sp. JGI-2019a]|nr:hypothetical protein FRB94_011387 [Tulasnella sp. JGI-2019a]KAG9005258.1 hypothetical protein FRB93_009812 [Tulasnella sp. JGI-2019a]KAG9024387.1 hypothetical protein FRB95_011563 [Tulasnella sp. JGI-2019a]